MLQLDTFRKTLSRHVLATRPQKYYSRLQFLQTVKQNTKLLVRTFTAQKKKKQTQLLFINNFIQKTGCERDICQIFYSYIGVNTRLITILFVTLKIFFGGALHLYIFYPLVMIIVLNYDACSIVMQVFVFRFGAMFVVL